MNKNMLRQAQQLQASLAKAQEELESALVEASVGGGAVKVVVTGKLKIQSIEISPDAVNPEDVEMLQDLVMAAINEALDKAQELAQSRINTITGGMKIPGLM
ncbi:YbaB/EbfC family nucleoid-associated protein [SAR202 cluster bacterium AC-647-N09_OGT_505m]|nr:YbaB/EbfC family nucleoid-associated protein [SAR202 cluster bacterium AC-647-N09_OGT_505m]